MSHQQGYHEDYTSRYNKATIIIETILSVKYHVNDVSVFTACRGIKRRERKKRCSKRNSGNYKNSLFKKN